MKLHILILSFFLFPLTARGSESSFSLLEYSSSHQSRQRSRSVPSEKVIKKGDPTSEEGSFFSKKRENIEAPKERSGRSRKELSSPSISWISQYHSKEQPSQSKTGIKNNTPSLPSISGSEHKTDPEYKNSTTGVKVPPLDQTVVSQIYDPQKNDMDTQTDPIAIGLMHSVATQTIDPKTDHPTTMQKQVFSMNAAEQFLLHTPTEGLYTTNSPSQTTKTLANKTTDGIDEFFNKSIQKKLYWINKGFFTMNAFYENKIIGTGKVEDDLKNPYVKTVYSFRDLYETTKTKGPQSNAFKDQSLDLANAFNLFVAQKNAHGIPEDENLKTTKNTLEDNIIEEPLAKKIMRPHDLEGNLS